MVPALDWLLRASPPLFSIPPPPLQVRYLAIFSSSNNFRFEFSSTLGLSCANTKILAVIIIVEPPRLYQSRFFVTFILS